MIICATCGARKREGDFYVRASGRRYTDCKACCSVKNLKSRRKPERLAANAEGAARHRLSRKLRVDAIKEATPCMDCGVQYPAPVMEFDHRPGEPKRFTISAGLTKSWTDVLEEMAKCDLVCANCHRLRTMRRGWTNQHEETSTQ